MGFSLLFLYPLVWVHLGPAVVLTLFLIFLASYVVGRAHRIIGQLREGGKSVILCTHRVDEAERVEWLGWPGWLTSPDKRVTERIRRVGNTLTWEATVALPRGG